MPGSATVIGRVAVKVVPDTGDFRGEAQRELSAIEKALKNIEIDFTANLSEVAREADRAVEAAEKAVKNKEIALTFDMRNQDELIRTINQIDRELDKLKDRTTVHVDLEDDEHLRQLRRVLEEELEKAKPQIRVKLQEFAHRKALGQMAYLARSRVATIYPNVNKAAAAKAGATIAALSGARGLSNIGKDFAEWVGNIDQSIPTITSMSLAVANLSSLTLTSTSNLLAFGGSLASIGGTALALPGILGGLGLGIGASIAVLKDFGDVLPGVGKRFSALQDSMSVDFWDKAEEPFRRFFTEIFPQFRDGMEQTADSLGTFFGNIADSATGTFDDQLAGMFDDLSDSIQVASGYTDEILSVIQQLGAVGAGNLPRLARWFGDITTDFDNWLANQGSEGLQHFVDQGIIALKDLGGFLSATGSTFAGLARAAEAAGGSTLGVMRDTMEGVAEAVNSLDFQRELREVFIGAHEGMSEIAQRSGPQFKSFMERLANTLDSVLPSAGRAAGDALGGIFAALDQPAVQKAAVGLFEDIEGIVSTLAPSLPGVARAFAAIAETVGDVAGNLAEALAPALDILTPAIVDLADDLDPLIDQLGKLLVNAVEGGAPVLADLAEILGDVAGAAAKVLAPINGLLDLFDKLPDSVQGGLSQLSAIGLLVGGGAWLGTAVRGKIGQFGGAVTNMAGQAQIGQGALYRMGSMAQQVTSRLSGLRTGAAAGVFALTSVADEAIATDSAFSNLVDIGGAALMGFMLGGLPGAIGGTIIGAFSKLIGSTDESNTAAEKATISYEGLRDTLNEVTGATTEATRALIYDQLERAQVLDDLANAGINSRTMVDAIMGQKDALAQVNGVLADQEAAYAAVQDKIKSVEADLENAATTGEGAEEVKRLGKKLQLLYDEEAAYEDILEALTKGRLAVEEDTKAARERGRAVTDYAALFKGDNIPKQVITHFEAKNIPRTAEGLARLKNRFKELDGKEFKAIIAESGYDGTMRRIKKILAELKTVDRQKPKPKVTVDTNIAQEKLDILNHKTKDFTRSKGEAKIGVDDKASKPVDEAKKKVTDFGKLKGVPTLEVNDNATPRINDIRESLNALDGQTATVTVNHRTVYSTSGTKGASPANERTVGREVGKVNVSATVSRVGIDADAAAQAGIKLANTISWALTQTMQARSNKISNLFDQLLREANSQMDAAYSRRFKKRITSFEEDVKQMNKFLNQLRAAKARLERLREELRQFKNAVTDSFMATIDPTQLGTSYTGIVKGMELSVERAQRFAAAIDQLIAAGLNDTTLQQLISAGPDAALEAAEAIAAGGVDQINDAQAQINAAAQQVGGNAGDYLFGDLIDAAGDRVKELVKALRPLQRQLRKEARKLIDALTDELKKELKKAGRGDSGSRSRTAPTSNTRTARIPTSGVDALDSGSSEGGDKTLNYYAAPGPQLTAEEQLFKASNRGRMTFP